MDTRIAMNKYITTKRDIYLDAVKGFLILCIVLEHNSLLTAQYDWIRPFCDAFAAGCFLILTFIRPLKFNAISSFFDKNYVYWWPFFIFITITGILNFYLFASTPITGSLIHYGHALLTASPQAIKTSSGFMYFWFLPCLCFLYLVRLIVQKSGKTGYLIMIIFWLFIGTIDDEQLIKTPFSLHVISFIFIIGLCYSKFHAFLIQPRRVTKYLTISIFIFCCVASYFVGWELFLAGGLIPSIHEPILLLYYSIFMFVAIPGIYNLQSLAPKFIVKILAILGEHSMKVYLFHPLIFIATTQVLPIIVNPIISFIFTVAASLLISLILIRFSRLNALIFPKAISALSFKRKS